MAERDKIVALLPDYCTGSISELERGRVEQHLAECSSCRERVRVILALLGFADDTSGERSDHRLSSNDVIQYYLGSELLDDATRGRIESAMESDPNLSFDLKLLRETETDLRRITDRQKSPELRERSGIMHSVWRTVRTPVFAYAVLLLAAYPAGRWLYDRVVSGDSQTNTAFSGQAFTLREMSRATDATVTVYRTHAEAAVLLELNYYHIPAEKQYRFTVGTPDGSRINDVELISNLAEPGRIHLLINSSSLDDGTYFLKLVESGLPPDVSVNEVHYPFELITED